MRLRTLQLIAALVALPAVATSQSLELIGTYDWQTELIVGVSGLEVDDNGRDFLAISDQGWWVSGALERETDTISGIRLDEIEPILGGDGLPAAARRVGDWSDAEGLTVTRDGTIYVSFERWAHVWRYDAIEDSATWIKDHETFSNFADNWQLEAIAAAPNGDIYLLSERPLQEGFPLYRLNGDEWVIDRYFPENDLFSIVGADFDQETGELYLLERKLVVGIWWQSRVRRVSLDGEMDEIIWTSERGEYGNHEGISLWRDPNGLRITLVSDNNGDIAAPTQFLEFRLTQ